MKENKKELIKLISKIAVALAVFVFVLINYKELVNIDVREIVSAAPSLLPAVLSVLAIYCVKGLVLVIPASLVYISVGMAFSPLTAVLVNIAGILVEFTASYLFGLFLGGDYINKMMQKQKYGKKILEMQENKKDASVFLMRFITVFPLSYLPDSSQRLAGSTTGNLTSWPPTLSISSRSISSILRHIRLSGVYCE